WYEAARLPKAQYDFIVSTVTLPLASSQYIRLSPLITDEEILKLKQYIKDYVQSTLHEVANKGEQLVEGEQWFRELQDISQAALQIINPLDIYNLHVDQTTSTVHQLLPELLQSVVMAGMEVIHDVEA